MSPYFAASYFTPTYFDTGGTTATGSGGLNRRRRPIYIPPAPEPRIDEEDDDLFVVRIL